MDDPMGTAFTTAELLAAFDTIGEAAVEQAATLTMAVYGGSALMLASNFRFASEDVDIAPLDPKPPWLATVVRTISEQNGWDRDWLNDAVGAFLSDRVRADDHLLFGTFPRGGGATGLKVLVPSAEYMLALMLKALRLLDPQKGETESREILGLMQVCGLQTVEEALRVLARYFPVSAAAPEKLVFLLKHLLATGKAADGTPRYPVAGR
jgi:hypothetical protein